MLHAHQTVLQNRWSSSWCSSKSIAGTIEMTFLRWSQLATLRLSVRILFDAWCSAASAVDKLISHVLRYSCSTVGAGAGDTSLNGTTRILIDFSMPTCVCSFFSCDNAPRKMSFSNISLLVLKKGTYQYNYLKIRYQPFSFLCSMVNPLT
jgi:hypothetical protein